MDTAILGLHHLTATVTAPQEDLDFYTGLLGLRLVKKTVNFDNLRVYHFYYGDERGAPGTIMTTLPYGALGVRVGVKGAGQVTVTSFSVPRGSLGYWRDRLAAQGTAPREEETAFGDVSLVVEDPSSLVVALVEADDARAGWTGGGVAADAAIRGLHSVTLTIREPERTLALLTGELGFTIAAAAGGRTRVAAGGAAEAGRLLDIEHSPDAPDAINGLGTVHHVALAIQNEGAQLALRDRLIELGYDVTEVRDRKYFRSIYFREPGGVLYEVATMGPGFTVDESADWLGQELKLPPWEEAARASIEAALPRVTHGGAGRRADTRAETGGPPTGADRAPADTRDGPSAGRGPEH